MEHPLTVSFFILKQCNFNCRFCYSTFPDVGRRCSNAEAESIIRCLAGAGVQKVTFVGGEPTLHPHIAGLVDLAHRYGMVTVVVSNGARLPQLLDACPNTLDWVGLDIDSIHEDVEVRLGRGTGGHVARTIELTDECHRRGIRLKLNSVVTSLAWQEDWSEVIRQIQPDRWKAFQVLPVAGQNDGIDDLLITPEQFKAWADRHAHLGVIPETNDLMSNTYALIDPSGRFYESTPAGHVYGKSILEVGVAEAWASVEFREEQFKARGGIYDWGGEGALTPLGNRGS